MSWPHRGRAAHSPATMPDRRGARSRPHLRRTGAGRGPGERSGRRSGSPCLFLQLGCSRGQGRSLQARGSLTATSSPLGKKAEAQAAAAEAPARLRVSTLSALAAQRRFVQARPGTRHRSCARGAAPAQAQAASAQQGLRLELQLNSNRARSRRCGQRAPREGLTMRCRAHRSGPGGPQVIDCDRGGACFTVLDLPQQGPVQEGAAPAQCWHARGRALPAVLCATQP